MSYKKKEYLSKSQAKVTEAFVRNWFAETEMYFEENIDILKNGSRNRVWNMDETAMWLNASGSYVVAESGKPAPQVGANDKENLTVLVSVNANGEVTVPMAVFACKRLPPGHILDKMPKNWCFENLILDG